VSGAEVELLWGLEGVFEFPGVLEFGEPGAGDVFGPERGVVGDVWGAVDG
jgi:hypothetical protein